MRDHCLELSNRTEIWQESWQRCYTLARFQSDSDIQPSWSENCEISTDIETDPEGLAGRGEMNSTTTPEW